MVGATEGTPLVKKDNACCSAALKVRIVTSIISLAEGYDIGVVNGAVVIFREELGLSVFQVGIVLAIFPFGVMCCAPLAGSFADWAGRKPTMMLSSCLLIAGGSLMACATSFEMLAAGRITAGSGVGVGITAVTAYMSEVSPAHSRGFYGALEELFVNVGNVIGYLANLMLLGVRYDWRIMLGLGIIPAVLVLIVLVLPYSVTGIPESPRYLQKIGRYDEAREILLDLLHGDVDEVDRAVEAWQLEAKHGGMASWSETLSAFFGRDRKAARAGIGCGVMNMWTGIMLMMVATTSLLMGAGMTKRSAMWTSVVLGLTKASVMLVVAVFMLDSWGRRPLLLTSLSFCSFAAALGGLSAHLALGDTWVIIALCLFVAGYSVGVGPVPWVYMPEVLDNRFRGKGCAMGLSGARACGVVHLFFFPMLFPMFGLFGLFVFLVTVNVLGFAYIAVFCPETKGCTLEQIKEIFHGNTDEKDPL